MNINTPVAAVQIKDAHVHFMISDVMLVNGRRIDAIPSKRRSTISIVPKTMVSPTTCKDSISGNT